MTDAYLAQLARNHDGQLATLRAAWRTCTMTSRYSFPTVG
ncbi:hypothetical protein I546_0625 [Mycobacterium kansasii 732]|nr:hypothetical protein I546_0625 [Mycobacterium kansasii 732]